MKGKTVCGWLSIITITVFYGTTIHAQQRKALYSFQNPCAERGDTLRHKNVINPLQNDNVICNRLDRQQSESSLPRKIKLSNAITLCNWNVYGLPVKQSGQRQENIADYVAYGCDIFSGQEHWIFSDRNRFRKQAQGHVPAWNFRYFDHPVPFHPGSGILIGSVWPIRKTQYSPWPGGIIRNAGYKGVGYAQIITPRGLLDLYNLHLAAGRSFKLKEKQLKHLVAFVNKTHDPNLPLAITGDFNFNQRWKLPSTQVNALDWLNEKLGVRPVGFKSRIEYTLLDNQLQYLDHRILANWATPREVYMSKPFIRELGDHPGIITRVQIQEE